MATLTPETRFTFNLEPALRMTFRMGIQGPAGVTDLTISHDPSNRLELKPDGLYVGPPELSSTNW